MELPSGISSPISLGPATGTVTTDASDLGIGVLYDGVSISEQIPDDFKDFHINVKELFALKRFLDLCPDVKDQVLSWRCDNNSAMAAIKNEGST